ncbi:MAG: GNAT family N-acetyltransferase [Pseudomonadota bacterium]
MAIRYMERFFDPQSIAVIGASERANSLGGTVLSNLLNAGFPGILVAVNRRGGAKVHGVPRYKSVLALEEVPELAIVCTSPVHIPGIVDELGQRGVRAVMIVMGGLSNPAPVADGALGQTVEWAQGLLGLKLDSGKTLKEATWEAARAYDMRIMGPNCIGTVVPRLKLNASYAHCMVLPGNVAYVGQSGVLALAVMDWARGRERGFSCVTSLGDSLDIDISDVLDYLADDPHTNAILLHVERVNAGGRFVSALRAAARNKLVIMMKNRSVLTSGKNGTGLAPDPSERNGVFNAVARRTGVLRVERTDQVLGALETLRRMRHLYGEKLAIISNGIGPALLASDQLAETGGKLASLAPESLERLQSATVATGGAGNPIDLGVIATPARFAQALEVALKDAGVDAVLVLHVPTLVAASVETAQRLEPLMQEARKPVLTSWMGDESAVPARELCEAAGVSTFDTPERAVDAFSHMVKYRRNQKQLEQVPERPRKPVRAPVDTRLAWAMAGRAAHRGKQRLKGEKAAALLSAAGIPVADIDDLDVKQLLAALQLRLGITRDEVFGPLVFLEAAGQHTGPVQRQVALPPLDLKFARLLIVATGVDAALQEHSLDAARDEQALAELLVALCDLSMEVPVISELVLYPVIVAADGVRAFGVTVEFGKPRKPAILPYPAELEETAVLPQSGREVTLRPIRGDDAPAHAAFASRLSPQAIRYRFFGPRTQFTRRQLAQFTQIDYAREMAFIASGENDEGVAETLGVVRAWTDPDNVSAEFAVIVDDALRGDGLGRRLLEKLIDYSRRRGTLELRGTVLPDNRPMRRLAEKLGFSSALDPEEGAIVVTLRLNEPQNDWQRKRLGD